MVHVGKIEELEREVMQLKGTVNVLTEELSRALAVLDIVADKRNPRVRELLQSGEPDEAA